MNPAVFDPNRPIDPVSSERVRDPFDCGWSGENDADDIEAGFLPRDVGAAGVVAGGVLEPHALLVVHSGFGRAESGAGAGLDFDEDEDGAMPRYQVDFA